MPDVGQAVILDKLPPAVPIKENARPDQIQAGIFYLLLCSSIKSFSACVNTALGVVPAARHAALNSSARSFRTLHPSTVIFAAMYLLFAFRFESVSIVSSLP